ncbi:hypothetical protein GX51_01168 [Blastomyces parvus]|uniref:Uncharacterized protein n=1 Tax=Blastomyces parvus TaxID=2060905 RepID=A0A2B7XJ47_9EURO|nr:hypothetical protein GX51_01168 [Blastomyces parvus]
MSSYNADMRQLCGSVLVPSAFRAYILATSLPALSLGRFAELRSRTVSEHSTVLVIQYSTIPAIHKRYRTELCCTGVSHPCPPTFCSGQSGIPAIRAQRWPRPIERTLPAAVPPHRPGTTAPSPAGSSVCSSPSSAAAAAAAPHPSRSPSPHTTWDPLPLPPGHHGLF